jgi:5-methylcytosine-specific restriction endonuclease McrA/predicted nucleic acid-binding Zn ribbon protein
VPRKNGGNKGLFCSRECSYLKRWNDKWRRKAIRVLRAVLLSKRHCVVCNEEFYPGSPASLIVVCGDECRKEHARQKAARYYQPKPVLEVVCRVCGIVFPAEGHGPRENRRVCSPACRKKWQNKYRSCYDREQTRRRKRVIAAGEKFNPFEVFHRDDWTCQLCGEPVKRDKKVPDPLAPVIDHIIPISKGGQHTVRNVQCAHFICNGYRSDSGPAQQLLFG